MRVFDFDAVVVGSGAAGYNAACRLKQFGKNVAVLTEGVDCGTSRNTGSDKQTYYKLGLGGDAPDSVRKMAEDLFAGGSVDGDNALCEAALSTRCFLNLCELGVEFPTNRYGEYVGYKTDHDPYARATSAGPLTSQFMTQALQRRTEQLEIPVLDGYLAVEVLKHNGRACGLLCMEIATGAFAAVHCGDIVLCTGGPAGVYADSVYPQCHTGSTGLALLAGAKAQNLTEWQYGLASVKPRWNVSGTYMQALPCFVSVDDAGEKREFLADFFSDPYEALSAVFLKGYQWPFDSQKVLHGSSVIDLLVYRECVLKKRRVYLDYTKNPFGISEIAFEKLSEEAFSYLTKADACVGTPIERLRRMNAPAVELYRNKGVRLESEPLEIALCAQHHNGGIAVDLWWQTSVEGLFAAGECAGTHGVSRPGGSALNAGQVGSLRAAQYIAAHGHAPVPEPVFCTALRAAKERQDRDMDRITGRPDNADDCIRLAQRRMSDCAAAIRDRRAMDQALRETRQMLADLADTVGVDDPGRRFLFYKLRDILVTQSAVLTAMIDYADTAGNTRGSALCYDAAGERREGLEECFRFTPEAGETRTRVQEIIKAEDGFRAAWRDVRPIPRTQDVFETVWQRYRETKNVE